MSSCYSSRRDRAASRAHRFSSCFEISDPQFSPKQKVNETFIFEPLFLYCVYSATKFSSLSLQTAKKLNKLRINNISLTFEELTLNTLAGEGARSPESCYFGQLLNTSSMLAIIFGFLRYQMLETYFEQALVISLKLKIINAMALVLMVMAGFGMSMVANFQENNVGVLHYTGAALVFGMGGLYILGKLFCS